MSDWTVILPVKPWALAKSRLDVDRATRQDIARALVLDTLRAVEDSGRVGRVLIVTAENAVRTIARQHGAHTIEDRPLLSADPLNDAIRAGRRWASAHRPHDPVAVLPTDLASLDGTSLAAALAAVTEHPSAFVPDAQGIGTTLLAAWTPDKLLPAYGGRSTRAHTLLGHAALLDVDPAVRRDVDTVVDLERARHDGVGPALSAVLAGSADHAFRPGHRRARVG